MPKKMAHNYGTVPYAAFQNDYYYPRYPLNSHEIAIFIGQGVNIAAYSDHQLK